MSFIVTGSPLCVSMAQQRVPFLCVKQTPFLFQVRHIRTRRLPMNSDRRPTPAPFVSLDPAQEHTKSAVSAIPVTQRHREERSYFSRSKLRQAAAMYAASDPNGMSEQQAASKKRDRQRQEKEEADMRDSRRRLTARFTPLYDFSDDKSNSSKGRTAATNEPFIKGRGKVIGNTQKVQSAPASTQLPFEAGPKVIDLDTSEYRRKKQTKLHSLGKLPRKPATLRLDRLLANRGVGSRTQVTALIRRGRIRTLQGEVLRDTSMHLPIDAILQYGDQLIEPLPSLLAYHKPRDIHSTVGDPRGRPNLLGVLPPHWHMFHPVGRLDADTSGLLLFASEGQLTHRLLHPKLGIEREYQVEVEGEVDPVMLQDILGSGVPTADGTYAAHLLYARGNTLRLVVTEGKHRMVRRMLANAGHPVVTLHRLRYGEVKLGNLPEGEVVEVDEEAEVWAQTLLAIGDDMDAVRMRELE